MCVLISSTNLPEAFLILISIQQDIITNAHGLHVKYELFLSEFNETSIFCSHIQFYQSVRLVSVY
jgi:hypothetical protein